VHNHDMLVGRRAGIDGACVRECMGGEEVGKHSCKGGMERAKCVQEGSNIGRSMGGDGQEWRRVEDERREESGYVVGSGRKGVCRWHGWRLEQDEKRRQETTRRWMSKDPKSGRFWWRVWLLLLLQGPAGAIRSTESIIDKPRCAIDLALIHFWFAPPTCRPTQDRAGDAFAPERRRQTGPAGNHVLDL